jgi:hypothetical protein
MGGDVGEDVRAQVGVLGDDGGVEREGVEVAGGLVVAGVEGGPGGERGEGADGGVQSGVDTVGHGGGSAQSRSRVATWRDHLTGWIAAYERAWRTPGTEALATIFTAEATYRQGPTGNRSSARQP